jgi:hypothetical protein
MHFSLIQTNPFLLFKNRSLDERDEREDTQDFE